MGPLHTKVFGPDNSWSSTDWFKQPAGIQRMAVNGRTDIWPSWYNKAASNPTVKMTFDKVSKKKATDCTPSSAKIELDVQKFTDPITKRDSYFAPDGYDPSADDNIHQCGEVPPNITTMTYSKSAKQITISVEQTSHPVQSVQISVNGEDMGTLSANPGGLYTISYTGDNSPTVTVVATDTAMNSSTVTNTL